MNKLSNHIIFWGIVFFCLYSCKSPNEKSCIKDISTSKALPAGMQLVWNDEFNDTILDNSKWSTNYYSTLDYIYRTNYNDFINNNLPQPDIGFTGNSIILKIDKDIPERTYWESGRKISSIQTYDWCSDKNMMNNTIGGFFEARIRRSADDSAKMVNIAFWFDSPGPDARYFVEKGDTAYGVEGIRPRGQVFEIDLCEYVTTEIVLHGNVSPEGKFEKNIGHYIVKGDFRNKWVTHSMLWSPAGLKFYIDGELIKEWWDPNDIKSPNHFMNMYFGAYGKDGEVSMEVDYIRYYQWELEKDNELPNGNFEYNEALFPWEGSATITTNAANNGKYGAIIETGDTLYQYVYLDNNQDYSLSYSGKGDGKVFAKIENITQVSGITENEITEESQLNKSFEYYKFNFSTNPEHKSHKRTVKVSFINTGSQAIMLDDVKIEKVR